MRRHGGAARADRARCSGAVRRAAAALLHARRNAGSGRDWTAEGAVSQRGRTQRYAVVHVTRYEYDQPVGLSRQILPLTPRETTWQTRRAHVIDVAPQPESIATSEDAFGNP